MIQLEKNISNARFGKQIDIDILLRELNHYEKVIIRGAGVFGQEIGKLLLKNNFPVNKLVYWDIRSEELIKLDGITVRYPFCRKYNSKQTLIINCIPNGLIAGSSIMTELIENGYSNIISGMGLYEACFCPMNEKTGFNPAICLNSRMCNWCCCDRLMHFLKNSCKKNSSLPKAKTKDKLSFQVITFVISLKCTLKCKHCGQYINSYADNEKINYPYARIKNDIDLFFDAVDTAGFVSIIGGEPFLHPDLNEIIKLLLKKNNFGMLGITTNGICKINEEHIKTLKNNRTRVIFSNYTAALNKHQKNIFYKNVEKLCKAGINYTVGVPLWTLPPSLKKSQVSDEIKQNLKSGCYSKTTCQTVQNGRYYPCPTAISLHTHKVTNYPSDYVVMDSAETPNQLREKIIELHSQPFYQSCNHCTDGGKQLAFPGEQGYDNRYDHLTTKQS